MVINTSSEVREVSVQTPSTIPFIVVFTILGRDLLLFWGFFSLQVKLQDRSPFFGNDIGDLNISRGTIDTHGKRENILPYQPSQKL